MKVCFLLISRGWGGGENVVHQMMSSLLDMGTDVFLITNNEMKGYFEDLNLEIIDLGSLYDSNCLTKMIINPNKVFTTPNSKPLKGINMFLMYFYFHRIKGNIIKLLKDHHVDILHTNLEYSDIMGSVLSGDLKDFSEGAVIKWILNIHGPWFSLFYDQHEFSTLSNFMFTNILKKIFKKTDKVVFVSKYLFKQSKKTYPSEKWDIKGLIVPNGIDLSRTENLSHSSVKKGFKILFPGGPKLNKGGDILIEALKDVIDDAPNIDLYIALDVPEDHVIRRMVKDYELEYRIHFVGFLKTQDYMSLLSQMDVLALPSRMEGFGMAYLEAMSFGVPVIASNVGGGAEIVKNNRNGLVVSPKRESVAKAILELYRNPDLREKISQNNLEDIQKFSWDNIIKNYLKIYHDLIKF